ncbi:MAG: bifunctional methylenetetrahydrofolate dehydrogenase/methenyltetrahydrofolate cyclohydrolase FolD [Myxococcota bacterium]
MAERIDGKAIAKRVRAEVAEQAAAFERQHGRAVSLHVVLVGDDPASHVYVRNKERAAAKAGIDGEVHRLDASTSQEEVEALVRRLNADAGVDGILVQLPLPEGLDARPIVELIDPKKDVDGLTTHNAGTVLGAGDGLYPCTPRGCMRLLRETGVDLRGKHALVIGRSQLVGRPMAIMLLASHATVTIAHRHTDPLEPLVRQADVLVVAVGRANLIPGDWIKPGAVVIDVGINRTVDGKLTGDVDFEGAQSRASAITPVPGGVGPMTIAMLLSNAVRAANLRADTP